MIRVISIIVVVLFYCLALAIPVQFLWNFTLVPAIDGINYIGFMQALGINLLCTLLFKNPTETKLSKNE